MKKKIILLHEYFMLQISHNIIQNKLMKCFMTLIYKQAKQAK